MKETGARLFLIFAGLFSSAVFMLFAIGTPLLFLLYRPNVYRQRPKLLDMVLGEVVLIGAAVAGFRLFLDGTSPKSLSSEDEEKQNDTD